MNTPMVAIPSTLATALHARLMHEAREIEALANSLAAALPCAPAGKPDDQPEGGAASGN